MLSNRSVNLYTFRKTSDSIRITYFPHAAVPLQGSQQSDGPRLEYDGPEGVRVFPRASGGPTLVTIQEDSPLGPLVSVILIPTGMHCR